MYSKSNSNSQNKVMTDEQFNQVVDAILSGKYSWACLLILRFSGYNPLHYIPYRTYNRLMKTNRDLGNQPSKLMPRTKESEPARFKQKNTRELQDIYYLEDADRQSDKIKGGKRTFSSNVITRLFS